MRNHVASGKSVDAKGRTVELAVESALSSLGRSREEVEVEVLRPASRGILGIGAHDAIVRVTELIPVPQPDPVAVASPSAFQPSYDEEPEEKVEASPQMDADEEKEEEEEEKEEEKKEEEEEEEEAPSHEFSRDEILALSRETLLDILERMNIIGDVLASWTEPEDERDHHTLVLDIIGDDLGLLIGRRGDTLRDLQYLVRLIIGRQLNGWANLIVDVEGYKQRREEAVRQKARRIAKRVAATERPAHLEPMNSYERRIVHVELSKWDSVTTKSSGEGEHRRVGVYPANWDESAERRRF